MPIPAHLFLNSLHPKLILPNNSENGQKPTFAHNEKGQKQSGHSESESSGSEDVDDEFSNRYGEYVDFQTYRQALRDENNTRAMTGRALLTIPREGTRFDRRAIVNNHSFVKYHRSSSSFVKESIKFSKGGIKKKDTAPPSTSEKSKGDMTESASKWPNFVNKS